MDIERTKVSAKWVLQEVLPKLKLTKGQRELVETLALLFNNEEEGSLELVLSECFDGVDENALKNFRITRDRLKERAGDTGLTLEMDSNRGAALDQRRAWLAVDSGFYARVKTAASRSLIGQTPSVVERSRAVRGSLDEEPKNTNPIVNALFIYHPEERELAEKLMQLLRTHLDGSKSFDFEFFDLQEDIRLGSSIKDAQERLVSSSRLIIPFCSAGLAADSQAQAWLRMAAELKKTVFPIRFIDASQEAIANSLSLKTVCYPDEGPSFQKSRDKASFVKGLARDLKLCLLQSAVGSYNSEEEEPDEIWSQRIRSQAKCNIALNSGYIERSRGKSTRHLPEALSQEDWEREMGDTVDALDEINRWAANPKSSPYYVVLGEYGMGKTTLLKSFALEWMDEDEQAHGRPTVAFLDLRYALSGVPDGRVPELEEVLANIFRRSWQTPGVKALEPIDLLRLVKQERGIIIFDGLDEVLVHLGNREGQQFIQELWRALTPDEARGENALPKAGKIIFSCRSSYFKDLRHQANAFKGQQREIQDDSLYQTLILLPFSDEQIQRYLCGSLGETEGKTAWETIKQIHNLADLGRRPYLLSQISQQVEKLEKLKLEGREVRAVDLYDTFVSDWLLRDDGKHTLAPEDKKVLMESLSAALWRSGKKEWSWETLRNWIGKTLAEDPVHAAVYLRDPKIREKVEEDFRTATFVLRPDTSVQSFRFAHTSMQEYFLACHLFRALQEGTAHEVWNLPKPSDETLALLGELIAREGEGLVALAELLETRHPRAGENAFRYWLVAVQKGLPAPSPRRVNLSGADLYEWKIKGEPGNPLTLCNADFTRTVLTATEWSFTDLSSADLSNSDLRLAKFSDSMLTNIVLADSDLSGAFWHRCIDVPELRDRTIVQDSRITSMKVSPQVEPKTSLFRSLMCSASPGNRYILTWTGRQLAIRCQYSGRTVMLIQDKHDTATFYLLSPNSKNLIIGNNNGDLEILNLQSGESQRLTDFHTRAIESLIISPDCKFLVSTSKDGTAKILEMNSFKVIHTLSGHEGTVVSAKISPDGEYLATCSADSTVKLWNVESGKEVASYSEHTDEVLCCDFSPDGKRVVSAGRDHILHVWSTAEQITLKKLKFHDNAVVSVSFIDAETIFTASHDGSIGLATPELGFYRTFVSNSGAFVSAQIMTGSEQVGLGTVKGEFFIVDVKSLRPIYSTIAEERLPMSHNVLFDYNETSKTIASVYGSSSISIWSAGSGQKLLSTSGSYHTIFEVKLSVDGKLIALATGATGAVILDSVTGAELQRYHDKSAVTSVAFCEKRNQLFVGNGLGYCSIYDLDSGRLVNKLRVCKSSITSIAITRGTRNVLFTSQDDEVCLMDTKKANWECLFLLDQQSVTCASLSSDQTTIIVCNHGFSIRYFDIASARLITESRLTKSWANCCDTSHDGVKVLVGTSNGDLYLGLLGASLQDGNEKHLLHGNWVSACKFIEGGNSFISSSGDGSLIIWDTETGQPLRQMFHGAPGQSCAIDLQRNVFTYLEEDSWRVAHAVGKDPETGEYRIYFPEACYDPN